MKRLSDVERNLILKHETTHIQQRHWFDLLCCEITLILQWFNPFAWLYIFYIKENHEFLADKAVIKSGISPVLYQAVLVNQRFQGPVFSFSNSFNYSKSLNRLVMIKKEKSSPWKRLTALAIVPVMGLFIWASAKPNYIIEYQDLSLDKILYENFDNVEVNSLNDSIKKTTNTMITTVIRNTDENADSTTVTYIATKVKNLNTAGTPVSISYVSTGTDKDSVRQSTYFINSGNALPIVYIDDVKSSLDKIKDIDKNEIVDIEVLKDSNATAEYGEEAKAGVMKIYTKGYLEKNPELRKKVEDRRKDNFIIKGGNVTNGLVLKRDSLKGSMISINGFSTMSGKTPLILVDGEKVEDLSDLPQSGIKDIKVYKADEAIDIFGITGKDGVMIINTQEDPNSGGTQNTLTIKSFGNNGGNMISTVIKKSGSLVSNPLIIVDGEEKDGTYFRDLKQENVQSIEVLKDEAMTKKYGDKGKNGVIVITTKK